MRRALLSAVILFVFAAPLWAQAPTPPQAPAPETPPKPPVVNETVTVVGSPAYAPPTTASATKTETRLQDIPQSLTIVPRQLVQDQLLLSLADVVRYVPGVSSHQGENNRDQVVIRGNSSSADFFVDGVRDDVQYHRDLYNLDRVEALKGPNALIFGRGGGGGIVNRVTKQPAFAAIREATARFGSFGHKRVTADLNQPFTPRAAGRLNAMFENSGSFRDEVGLERYAINPTVTFRPAERLTITTGVERLHDRRIADRGITSFAGQPAAPSIGTFFGDPRKSFVRADVTMASATIERRARRWTLRNRTLVAHYDRAYQNFVPGAVSADRTLVALTAYNNATTRMNVFNQTDLIATLTTGALRHRLLAGAEFGRQATENFRNTGFFNNASTSIQVPFEQPTVNVPMTFRQSATDADNRVRALVAAFYGQDQLQLSERVELIGGVRLDTFTIRFHNNRNDTDLSRTDHLVSPRAAVVVKPIEPLSLYGSYSVSYLPSSGDQFSSLTTITEQVKPEKFLNYEAGAKWQAGGGLLLSGAVYRLDRVNSRATDPNDPTRILQTGSQRTTGWEVGVSGNVTSAWQVAGGYSHQRARVTSATAAAPVGAEVAQVPQHTLALWNLYQFHRAVGAGVGIVHRSAMFAGIDNRVTLPGYTDADVAVYVSVFPRTRLQVNVENLFDRRYYVNADSNTNISPGSPRAVRVSLVARF